MAANASQSSAELADKLDVWAKKLSSTAQSIRNKSEASFDDRVAVSSTAQEMLRAVQQPMEQLMASFSFMVQFTAMRLFVKWKVFETLPSQGTISYKELAEKVGAEEALISKSSHFISIYLANLLNRAFFLDLGWHWDPSSTGTRPS